MYIKSINFLFIIHTRKVFVLSLKTCVVQTQENPIASNSILLSFLMLYVLNCTVLEWLLCYTQCNSVCMEKERYLIRCT